MKRKKWWVICGHCRGEGQVPDGYCASSIIDCPTCDGTGKLLKGDKE